MLLVQVNAIGNLIVEAVDCDSGALAEVSEDISQILEANRAFWRLSRSTNLGRFIEFLQTKGQLRPVKLLPVNHQTRSAQRFIWKDATPFEIALSLKRNAHLTNEEPEYIWVGVGMYTHANTSE